MKKSLIILIVLLLISPVISAVEFDMKTEFSQGETLIAKVSGNFLEPILKENIFFYRGHVRISMDPYVTKINDDFYIYSSLIGKTSNNYSIVVKDAKYYIQGGQISEEDIAKDFLISNKTADFSINPGFVLAKDNFFIEVRNLQDTPLIIEINTNKTTDKGFFSFLVEDEPENSITLKAGEIKKINFEISNITQPVLEIVELSTDNLKYEIPVYIYAGEEESEKGIKAFNFEPSELNISLSTNSNATRIVYLYNTGEETLENISLSVSDSLKQHVSLSIKNITELEKNSSVKIELFFSSDDEEKIIEGQIKAKASQDIYAYSAVSLNFLKGYVPLEENKTSVANCLEMKGVICLSGEKCDKETIYAKDGVCCLGACKKIEKSSTGKIIGWAILLMVIVFLIWFFKKKYKGAKREVNFFERKPSVVNPYENKFQKPEMPLSRPLIREIKPPITRTIIKEVEKPVIQTIVKEVEKPVIKEVEKKVFIERPRKKLNIPKYDYIGSTKSKTYHKRSCRLSKLIKRKYKLSNNDLEFFKKQGYKACKICLKG